MARQFDFVRPRGEKEPHHYIVLSPGEADKLGKAVFADFEAKISDKTGLCVEMKKDPTGQLVECRYPIDDIKKEIFKKFNCIPISTGANVCKVKEG